MLSIGQLWTPLVQSIQTRVASQITDVVDCLIRIFELHYQEIKTKQYLTTVYGSHCWNTCQIHIYQEVRIETLVRRYHRCVRFVWKTTSFYNILAFTLHFSCSTLNIQGEYLNYMSPHIIVLPRTTACELMH